MFVAVFWFFDSSPIYSYRLSSALPPIVWTSQISMNPNWSSVWPQSMCMPQCLPASVLHSPGYFPLRSYPGSYTMNFEFHWKISLSEFSPKSMTRWGSSIFIIIETSQKYPWTCLTRRENSQRHPKWTLQRLEKLCFSDRVWLVVRDHRVWLDRANEVEPFFLFRTQGSTSIGEHRTT